MQVFVFQNSHDVSNVSVQVNRRAEQMCPLAQAGERRREDLVVRFTQDRSDSTPVPASMPSTVHQQVSSQLISPLNQCRLYYLACVFPHRSKPYGKFL